MEELDTETLPPLQTMQTDRNSSVPPSLLKRRKLQQQRRRLESMGTQVPGDITPRYMLRKPVEPGQQQLKTIKFDLAKELDLS